MQDGHTAIEIVRRIVTVPLALTVCLSMATSFPAPASFSHLGSYAKFVDSEEMWSWDPDDPLGAFRTNSVSDSRRVASERCAGSA